MRYILETHENQHGYGVSLVAYDHFDELLNGFVLNTFPAPDLRDQYVTGLADMTGFEVRNLFA